MCYQLPYLAEALGKTRARGAGLLATKEATQGGPVLRPAVRAVAKQQRLAIHHA